MTRSVSAITLGVAALLMQPTEGRPADSSASGISYLLIDATMERVLETRWEDPDRAFPIGSLIKPFSALAYAATHRFSYPTFVCRGSADGCWLLSGHGRVGMAQAVAGSCNAYFRKLGERTSAESFVAILQRFGMRVDIAAVTPAAMVGLGQGLEFAPRAGVHGYLELVARAAQPGVAPVLMGMIASAKTGTGRAVGAALGSADAFVKTGTAPCRHSPSGSADGYTIVVYPADRPRMALLVQA